MAGCAVKRYFTLQADLMLYFYVEELPIKFQTKVFLLPKYINGENNFTIILIKYGNYVPIGEAEQWEHNYQLESEKTKQMVHSSSGCLIGNFS